MGKNEVDKIKIIVTGGNGFIGSHLVDALVKDGHAVTVLDNFNKQMDKSKKPAMNPEATYVVGDVRKEKDWLKAGITKTDAIIHLAAKTSVEESFFNPCEYISNNCYGTAVMYNLIAKNKIPIKKIILASSIAVYGEGPYLCKDCGKFYPQPRQPDQLKRKEWDIRCPKCNSVSKPLERFEDDTEQIVSTYALTKNVQEKLATIYGDSLGITTIMLRYFNVYGPRQGQNNPYTGVVTIFLNNIKNGENLIVHEDGLQTRDFVHVKDVVNATILALKKGNHSAIYNVGNGKSTNIRNLAELLIKTCKSKSKLVVDNKFRVGDVRHGSGSIKKIVAELGFKPSYSIEAGLKELADGV